MDSMISMKIRAEIEARNDPAVLVSYLIFDD